MPAAPIPHDEARRLAALAGCKVLDTPAEDAFDDIVQLARFVCNAPVALVSLVDRDRQWFKARVGFPHSETSRDISFCSHAVSADAVLIVDDVLADARFLDNPLVTEPPHVRFYAGVPVHVDGAAVGTLCVLDYQPRQLTPTQEEALAALARRVERELLLRRDATARRGTKSVTRLPSAAGDEALYPGARVLERYVVHRLIAVGGMGAVFEATDDVTAQRVAVKTLTKLGGSAASVERFVREGLALRALAHPNVARILDAGNLEDGAPCIVMELLDGTLASATDGRSVTELAALVRQAALGAGAAHAQGIVHRDIKPGNLLVRATPDGVVVKVVDFGIAKLSQRHLGTSGDITSASDVIGSPHYMAPEQMLASRDVGPAADVWSLGVVLFELVTGRLPFQGDMTAICAQIFTSAPPSMRALRDGVPEALDAIVRRALQRDAHERYADGAALADALGAAIAGAAARP